MAVTYRLRWASPATVDDARSRLAELLEARTNEYGVAVREGMTMDVHRLTGRGAEIFAEDFGFQAVLSASFQPDYNADDEVLWGNLRAMVAATTVFVIDQNAEAVLLLDGEVIVFQHRAGVLALNSGWSTWTTRNLVDVVPKPYVLTELPSPVL